MKTIQERYEKKEIQNLYPNKEIMVNPLSLSISCHIGPGALAVAYAKNVNNIAMKKIFEITAR